MSMAQKFMEECRDWARPQIAGGAEEPAAIVEGLVDLLRGDYELQGMDELAEAVVAELVAEHLKAQASWPAPTDCDRLDRAFEALDHRGILARQNYWCCQPCGATAIVREVEQAKADGRLVRGFAFYHEQDTERAAEGEGLFIAFGAARSKGPPLWRRAWRTLRGKGTNERAPAHDLNPHLEIAREIVGALEEAQVEVAWSGDLRERIFVRLDWRRRRGPDGAPLLPWPPQADA